MQSVKPPVEAPMSTQGRPVRLMDQWARARSSLRPPRLTYLRSEPRRRMTASEETGVPGLSMRCSSTRTRPARMRACARSREAAWPRSTRSLSIRCFDDLLRWGGGGLLIRLDLSWVFLCAKLAVLLYENEIAISPVEADADCDVSSFRVK